MFGFSNCDTAWLKIATWAFFMVLLGSYNLVSNIIKKRYIKGVVMELDDGIDDCENRLRDAMVDQDDGCLDMDFFIDDLWTELDELKELKGAYDD